MNILFVCKRYYTGKDVIRHKFGRLYEIPRQLAYLGHHIRVWCFDYHNTDPIESFSESFGAGSVTWHVIPLRNIVSAQMWRIYRDIKAKKPDIILGSSDIPCLWIARKVASITKSPYAVDLYDNYESFGQARIFGFRRILKSCVNNAAAVISVSSVLSEKILNDYAPKGIAMVMNNGIEKKRFFPGGKAEARAALGLPANVRLIGTAGNLFKMKGLDTVYESWKQLELLAENVFLVLAGRIDSSLPIPSGARIIYLGELPEEQVSLLFRALDVGIIPAHDSAFGRYCFPQKLFEMAACDLPFVAAKVGAISELLKYNPEMLFLPSDDKNLVSALLFQLEHSYRADIKVMQWNDLVKSIEPVMLGLAGRA